ncbi:MAG: class II aldolase/adducin family protein, partial [Xanthobacteraceae bacterium]
TAIHTGVYRARPDVQVVGHGHPPMSTLFTMVDRPMIAIRNYGFRFIGIPVHPDPTHIRTAEQGDAVARTLGRRSCCLLRGHGSVVTAKSIPEVFLDSLEMEENARSTVHAASLGPLKPITPEEVELLKVSFARNDYRVAKTWEHYQEKARLAGFL